MKISHLGLSHIDRSDCNPAIQREREGHVYIRHMPYFCLNALVLQVAIIQDKELLMAKYISQAFKLTEFTEYFSI